MSTEPDIELFIPPPYCKKIGKVDGNSEDEYVEEVSLAKLQVSNPAKLLQLLEKCNDKSSKRLEAKLNKYLQAESESKVVFLINLIYVSEEAVVNVVLDKALENFLHTPLSDESIKNIIQYKDDNIQCAQNLDPNISALIKDIVPEGSGEVIIVPVLSYNELKGRVRFIEVWGRRECFVNTVMAHTSLNRNVVYEFLKSWAVEISVQGGGFRVIIKDIVAHNSEPPEVRPVYLACFVNSKRDNEYISKLVNETFKYCLTLLINTREWEEEKRLKAQCQKLLLVARKLFSHLGDLSDLLKEIMSEARRLTNAERCSLFLLDPDHMHLVAKVFDGVSPAERSTEVRIAKDQGIAGHVAATGQLLNIKDAYKHPLFFKGMDEATGFKTRNILCFPIRDEDNIVGVAQLCNKVGGNFDYFDEQVANAFSIYCGISIMHSLVYKRIQDAQARSQLSNELMMYHMQVSDQDVADVLTCPSIHTIPEFTDFSFPPRQILHKEIPCFVLNMFEDLNFIETFRIKKDILARFLLYVKRGYRDLPYHNWVHAFSVAHFAYLCLKNFKLIEKGYLTPLEALAYVVSCLCHDIDHRGTTNSFQQQSNSVLASLYSSEGSVMERHHLSQTMCTLNTEGCNFLESLSRDNYIRCLDLIKDMILATDLANHYKIHNRQMIMAQEGFDKRDPEHRFYLVSLLMTCADLSDQTKDWTETKNVAQLIYSEFFAQGDLEKKMGKVPANMMDREKASIPDHQLEFLNACCITIFKILATIFPSAKVLVEAMKQNIICWEASKPVFHQLCLAGKTSFEALVSDELEEQIRNTLQKIASNPPQT